LQSTCLPENTAQVVDLIELFFKLGKAREGKTRSFFRSIEKSVSQGR
jgi:hypothetical protein